jgi:hypothetical protein
VLGKLAGRLSKKRTVIRVDDDGDRGDVRMAEKGVERARHNGPAADLPVLLRPIGQARALAATRRDKYYCYPTFQLAPFHGTRTIRQIAEKPVSNERPCRRRSLLPGRLILSKK